MIYLQKMSDCVFCDSVLEVVEQSEYSIALYDKFPVSQGHTLIIPKNHYKTYFDLPVEVRNDMLVLLDAMKQKLDKELKPSGYNIGINSGASAGQTVFHCHIHLIPRYNGDMDNPDGGVRGVIPEKQKY